MAVLAMRNLLQACRSEAVPQPIFHSYDRTDQSSNAPSGAPHHRVYRTGSQLAFTIETRYDQYGTKNQNAAANKRGDSVRRAFGSLKFQVSDLGHILGLLRRKYRDRKSDESKDNQCRTDTN
jgi:hypothetical protein